jgi:anti-sigma-K factor RskA
MADDRRSRTMTPEDEAATALAPFFAAARAAPPGPPVSLLSAILADAAEATAPPAATAASARTRWRAAPPALGGWRAVTALAACVLLGFWLGLAGGVTIEGTTLRAGTVAAADADDPVEAFFELAAVE